MPELQQTYIKDHLVPLPVDLESDSQEEFALYHRETRYTALPQDGIEQLEELIIFVAQQSKNQ